MVPVKSGSHILPLDWNLAHHPVHGEAHHHQRESLPLPCQGGPTNTPPPWPVPGSSSRCHPTTKLVWVNLWYDIHQSINLSTISIMEIPVQCPTDIISENLPAQNGSLLSCTWTKNQIQPLWLGPDWNLSHHPAHGGAHQHQWDALHTQLELGLKRGKW